MRRFFWLLWLAPLALVATCALVPRAPLAERLRPAPVRLFARPLVLAPGVRASAEDVTAHLRRVGYRPAGGASVGRGEFRLAAGRLEVGLRPFRYPDGDEPEGLVRVRFAAGVVRELSRGDGAPLPAVWLEPERLGALGAPFPPVVLDRIPQPVVDAVLVQEDRRFFTHPGVDPLRIASAAFENLRERRVAEGASTITQQLARSLYLTRERRLSRKLSEVALAVWLEAGHSKREILEAYLNQVYLGHGHGAPIQGVPRAARFYFGKDVSQLGVAEGALLAGMIRAPNRFSPLRHPERARAQRDRVLDLLLAKGQLDPAAHARAREAPLRVHREPAPRESARHFADLVRRRLTERVGAAGARRGGVDVWTTLESDLQRAAEDSVSRELASLEARFPALRRRGSPLQAALVALDPRTGDVLALVGDRGLGASAFDRAVSARRQPGSLFKPIVALAALSSDAEPPFTLATLLEDAPLALEVEGETWRPANYDGRYRGAVTLRTALEQSLNVPFARLGLETGLVRIADTARRLGVESPLRPVPSLALGAFELTPLEITAVYAAFAAGGVRTAPRTTLAVTGAGGRPLGGERVTRERVFAERDV
ncbi:MAG TPA: transglycosylase domain-containing protein, partial [Myxococcota bacterium]|nr:transglycosylase domain-containing protein [Myxococcota bacterium]